MEPGRESRQFHWNYRVVEDSGELVLQSLGSAGWLDLYAFTREPNFPVDYEMSNHFTSTYPASPFRHGPIIQRVTTEARYVLRGRELIVERGGEIEVRMLKDDEEVLRVIALTFGLDFPLGDPISPVTRPDRSGRGHRTRDRVRLVMRSVGNGGKSRRKGPEHDEKDRITTSRRAYPPNESLSQTIQSTRLAPGGSEWVVIFRESAQEIFSWHHMDLGRFFSGFRNRCV